MDYVGTRWYKCDFHLHTMKSDCYVEKKDTENDWINQVKNVGLNCIAVTDHNDYRGIDKIKSIAEKEGIVTFPGVEVTCDSSKIHLLIIFDVDKNEDSVRDFLSKLDIDGESVGKSIGTSKGIFDVCKLAKEKDALVIAAHIDEYNGINAMNNSSSIEKVLSREYLDAVQVVNKKIWEEYVLEKDKEKMLIRLKEKYEKVTIEEAEKWRKIYNKALNADLPIVEFSDNPCEENNPKHGLWGIGKTYTWLKMDKQPTLESIRQALLSEDMRIKVCSESSSMPEQLPDMWVKSLKLIDSSLNPYAPIEVDFNPQLNVIIGGRGSGKSAVIRLLTGGLQAGDMLTDTIKKEQQDFYKENRNNLGIFTNKTILELSLYRNHILYKIVISNVKSMENQNRELYKQDEFGEWKQIDDSNFLDFFQIQSFTQKQIFDIAKESDALLKIIDNEINGITDAKREKENAYDNLLAKIAEIRNLEIVIASEGKLNSELKDINEQIENHKKSGIANLISNKQQFQIEDKKIQEYINENEQLFEILNTTVESMNFPDKIEFEGKDELNKLIDTHNQNIISSINEIKGIIEKQKVNNNLLKNSIKETNWYKENEKNEQQYMKACADLTQAGIAVNKLDELLEKRKKKMEEIANVKKAKESLKKVEDERKVANNKFIVSCQKIREMRRKFIDSVLSNKDNVKIEIIDYGNRMSFEKMIKNLTQKDNASINEDINYLTELVFDKNIKIEKFREIVINIRNGVEDKSVSAIFRKAVINMDSGTFDKMLTFLPDDELRVSYKPEGSRSFMPLSTASAGQKTTAILTFILAYGKIPLLLDQPEDDLDNKLVYDLVVKRLKRAKQNRQVIVVTHNANIPVNGDAEYIISMDAESRYVKTKYKGTLDNADLRKEICDVMEGTEHAFEMRAKKYHLRIKE